MNEFQQRKACSVLIFLFMVSLWEGSVVWAAQDEMTHIIDMHCHVAGVGAGESGCFISEDMRRSWKYKTYLEAFGVTEADLRQHGDSLVVAKLSQMLDESKLVDGAVILALDGVVDDQGNLDKAATEVFIPNSFVAEEVRKYDNLYFGASINPLRTDALERLNDAKAKGAVLIKWLPAIQHFDPADERFIPFYQRLRELNLPLLCHAGKEEAFTKSDNSLGDPERLRLPLSLGVTVIAAHAATTGENEGVENMERLLPMFDQYANLYTDISSLTQLNKKKYLPRLLKHEELTGRLLYGTDMPLINTGLTSPWFFLFSIGPFEVFRLLGEGNPWDRDVRLKKAVGVPEEVFYNGARVLNIDRKN